MKFLRIVLFILITSSIILCCSKTKTTTEDPPVTPPVDTTKPSIPIADNKVDTLGNWLLVHKADTGSRSNLAPQFSQVMFPTKDTGYLVDDYYFNTVFVKRTYNGGKTWTYTRMPGETRKLQFMSANVGFAYKPELPATMLGESRNNGDSWIGYPDLTIPYAPIFTKLSFPSDKTIYAITRIGQCLKITNPLSSQLYSKVAGVIPTSDDCDNLYFPSLKEGWVVVNHNGLSATDIGSSVYATSDSGTTWQMQYSTTDTYMYEIFFADNKTGWITTHRDYFYKTTNGTNWNKIKANVNTPYPVKTNKIIFLTTQHGFMTSDNEIFETNNGGTSWNRICKFGNMSVYDMYFTKPDILWICTSNSLYSFKL